MEKHHGDEGRRERERDQRSTTQCERTNSEKERSCKVIEKSEPKINSVA